MSDTYQINKDKLSMFVLILTICLAVTGLTMFLDLLLLKTDFIYEMTLKITFLFMGGIVTTQVLTSMMDKVKTNE